MVTPIGPEGKDIPRQKATSPSPVSKVAQKALREALEGPPLERSSSLPSSKEGVSPHEAAHKIAAFFYEHRGLLHRFAATKKDIESKIQGVKADSGHSPVFLFHAHGTITKETGRQSPVEVRFMNIERARKFLSGIGAKALIVPRACLWKGHTIEELLPIHSSQEYNTALYLNHLDAFDQVVREFLKFAYQFSLMDIQRSQFWRPGGGVEMADYGNAPLFLSSGQGRLGLIDLVLLMSQEPCQEQFLKAVDTTLIQFPFHGDLIWKEAKKTAKKLGYELSSEWVEKLTKITNDTQAFFHKIYLEHRDFLARHGITSDSATKAVSVTPGQKEVAAARCVEIVSQKLLESWEKFPVSYPPPISLTYDDDVDDEEEIETAAAIPVPAEDLAALKTHIHKILLDVAPLLIQATQDGIERILQKFSQGSISQDMLPWPRRIKTSMIAGELLSNSRLRRQILARCRQTFPENKPLQELATGHMIGTFSYSSKIFQALADEGIACALLDTDTLLV